MRKNWDQWLAVLIIIVCGFVIIRIAGCEMCRGAAYGLGTDLQRVATPAVPNQTD